MRKLVICEVSTEVQPKRSIRKVIVEWVSKKLVVQRVSEEANSWRC